jgi:hypothetical protein
MALAVWFWLPKGPESAWFLNHEERMWATSRIAKDNVDYITRGYGSNDNKANRLTKRDVQETIRDWKTWYVLVFNICASVPNQTFSVFLPLVVQGLGYSALDANLVSRPQCLVFYTTYILTLFTQMSVPPYVCGAIGLYLFALSSDHR